MVGARFRRNKAKPCRGLLIRATGWRALAARVPLGLAAAGVGAVVPGASGSASSLVGATSLWMLRPGGAMGCCGAVGPELRFGAVGRGRSVGLALRRMARFARRA